MNVDLIDFTGKGTMDEKWRAAKLMIFTKSTRLQMEPSLMDDINSWSEEKLLQELSYMANTIPSSWEFCDYTFLISGVTRAFTHQLVRTRTASFAQQTMRVLDVSEGPGWDYLTGPSIPFKEAALEVMEFQDQEKHHYYHKTMETIADGYKLLIDNGAAIEDARGILPTNILTNIVMKCNMRTFVELVRKRSSSRTQGEYRDVLEAMKKQVRAVHPWIDLFIDRDFDQAANKLDSVLQAWANNGFISQVDKTNAIKLLDIMRTQQ